MKTYTCRHCGGEIAFGAYGWGHIASRGVKPHAAAPRRGEEPGVLPPAGRRDRRAASA